MYTFESRVRYSETDCEGKLTMASLINYFQDCSTFQSEDLGLGLEYLKQRHLVWVLSSWQIVVDRYPKMGERVTIGTLPYEIKGFLGYRNFFMKEESGAYIARANSLWSLLNTETGRPAAVLEEMLKGYQLSEKLDMDYAPRRIAIPGEGIVKEALVVKKHHLDTNHHVNNQQFIDMAMDYLPDDFRVGQVRAEYKKQAFLNDVLTPRVTETDRSVVIVLADGEGKPYMTAEFLRA
ncbi:MAG: acyl-[acyl-carrier-protein] thioesterase [Lachnospiraceae bacterium]|jgi:medium-chain acyl-[acyl-carrier-protein] hydrolase|nr:acyl-[acyl-carrier-protein] thioesterase [Lachnospiraceae bacterium]